MPGVTGANRLVIDCRVATQRVELQLERTIIAKEVNNYMTVQ